MTQSQKAFNATAEGQKAMFFRSSRIGLLLMMNEAIRKIDPGEAYPNAILEGIEESQIDQWQEDLRQTWNRLKTKG